MCLVVKWASRNLDGRKSSSTTKLLGPTPRRAAVRGRLSLDDLPVPVFVVTPTWYAPQCLKLVVAEIRKWEGHDILVMFDKGVSYTASHCHLSRMPFERSSSSGSSYISVRGLGRVTISKCTMISLIGAQRYLQIRCPVSKETQMLPPS